VKVEAQQPRQLEPKPERDHEELRPTQSPPAKDTAESKVGVPVLCVQVHAARLASSKEPDEFLLVQTAIGLDVPN